MKGTPSAEHGPRETGCCCQLTRLSPLLALAMAVPILQDQRVARQLCGGEGVPGVGKAQALPRSAQSRPSCPLQAVTIIRVQKTSLHNRSSWVASTPFSSLHTDCRLTLQTALATGEARSADRSASKTT